MKYCRLENKVIVEIFTYNPFEWIPNESFLENCLEVEDNTEIKCGFIYEDGNFKDPDIKTQQEKRQESYEQDEIISWQDEMITVDSANTIYVNYFAEDNEKASEIKVLIKEAKETIREKYPDMEV